VQIHIMVFYVVTPYNLVDCYHLTPCRSPQDPSMNFHFNGNTSLRCTLQAFVSRSAGTQCRQMGVVLGIIGREACYLP